MFFERNLALHCGLPAVSLNVSGSTIQASNLFSNANIYRMARRQSKTPPESPAAFRFFVALRALYFFGSE
jgi:hypothetical protein